MGALNVLPTEEVQEATLLKREEALIASGNSVNI
jgi:hypothetical protein